MLILWENAEHIVHIISQAGTLKLHFVCCWLILDFPARVEKIYLSIYLSLRAILPIFNWQMVYAKNRM